MTLILKTESHGEVEAGFFASFMAFSRLDKYCFVTKHLCELARKLAQNPSARKGRILAYGLEKFGERFSDHLHMLMEALGEADPYLPELAKFDETLHTREANLEDEVDLFNEGHLLEVNITQEGKLISFGEYWLSSLEFGRMTLYLAHGGFCGWPGEPPAFASSLPEAIKASQNPLYLAVQQEMRG